jgi:hypothetical protein
VPIQDVVRPQGQLGAPLPVSIYQQAIIAAVPVRRPPVPSLNRSLGQPISTITGRPNTLVGLPTSRRRPARHRGKRQRGLAVILVVPDHDPLPVALPAAALTSSCAASTTLGRELRFLDAGAGQNRVERVGELPSPAADQEPEAGTWLRGPSENPNLMRGPTARRSGIGP